MEQDEIIQELYTTRDFIKTYMKNTKKGANNNTEKITTWNCVIKPSLISMGVTLLILLPFIYLFSIPIDNYNVPYKVVGMHNPMNGYCEYQLYGVYEVMVVDRIGKYYIGQTIRLSQ